MAKKSKEEFLKGLSAFIGDNKSDEAIALLEDAADSFEGEDVTPYETEIAELKAKAEEIENNWREKYKARFVDYTPQTVPEEVTTSVLESDETPELTDENIIDMF